MCFEDDLQPKHDPFYYETLESSRGWPLVCNMVILRLKLNLQEV